ncbi:MAG: helix-turn-helix transcriptional regulator [Lachnospiraceae bacterium]|nr:helix-turn-helix transcriptional regulator [Lachnospiraceae bacterium]
MDRKRIGSFVRAKRKEKGYTQKQLGDMIGLSDRAVSRWENGIGLPDVEILIPLSRALGVSVDVLLTGGENKRSLVKDCTQDNFSKKTEKVSLHRRAYILLLISIILLIFFSQRINSSSVEYSDGLFCLKKEQGQYFPCFYLAGEAKINDKFKPGSIQKNRSSVSYDFCGMTLGFGPGSHAKQYDTITDMKRDTGIIMDQLLSGFSDSPCIAYVDGQGGCTDRRVNIITRRNYGSRSNGILARFTFIISDDGSDQVSLLDDASVILQRPSVHRLQCANGDVFYIMTFKGTERTIAYHYSESKRYICTLTFDTSDLDVVDSFIESA